MGNVLGRVPLILCHLNGNTSNTIPGKLDSSNRSWQSEVGTFRALVIAEIEPTPSESDCDWTPLSPSPTVLRGCCNTIPDRYMSAFLGDAAAADTRPNCRPQAGSRLFEINIWMWSYERYFPHDVLAEEAVAMWKRRVQEFRARGAATLKRRCLASEDVRGRDAD